MAKQEAQTELPPLTQENIEQEIQGLYEDLLNWDYGHAMEPVATVIL